MQNVTVLFSDLGLHEHQRASVRDLWAKKDLGVFTGRFVAADLPQHGSMMVAIAPHFD